MSKIKKRTVFNLPPHIKRRLKKIADFESRTMTSVVIDLIEKRVVAP